MLTGRSVSKKEIEAKDLKIETFYAWEVLVTWGARTVWRLLEKELKFLSASI